MFYETMSIPSQEEQYRSYRERFTPWYSLAYIDFKFKKIKTLKVYNFMYDFIINYITDNLYIIAHK